MLFCSAGVMLPPVSMEGPSGRECLLPLLTILTPFDLQYGSLTSHSHELQFGTNVLGHHYLIKLLLPTLLASKTPTFTPRVCLTSSAGHMSGPMRSDRAFKPEDPFCEKAMAKWVPGNLKSLTQYGNSKMGNVLQAGKLHRIYFAGEGADDDEAGGRLIITSVHPGILKTDLARHLSPEKPTLSDRVTTALMHYVLFPLAAYAPSFGALNQLYACTLPDQEAFRVGLSGSYVGPWCRLGRADRKSEDKKAQDDLWDWCEGEVDRLMGDKRGI